MCFSIWFPDWSYFLTPDRNIFFSDLILILHNLFLVSNVRQLACLILNSCCDFTITFYVHSYLLPDSDQIGTDQFAIAQPILQNLKFKIGLNIC